MFYFRWPVVAECLPFFLLQASLQAETPQEVPAQAFVSTAAVGLVKPGMFAFFDKSNQESVLYDLRSGTSCPVHLK